MHCRRPISTLVFSLALAAALGTALPMAAQAASNTESSEKWRWEGSAAEEATAKGVDAVLIRPLALVRVIVGAAMMLPASLFSSPGGSEAIKAGYEVLVELPMEYAFKRPLGADL